MQNRTGDQGYTYIETEDQDLLSLHYTITIWMDCENLTYEEAVDKHYPTLKEKAMKAWKRFNEVPQHLIFNPDFVFDTKTIENLEWYVYFLVDSRTKQPFYIGKGINNRVFDHISHAFGTDMDSNNYNKIREIRDAQAEVQHIIVRHGLSEIGAFEVEAALIDTFSFLNIELKNSQGGHHSEERGLMTSDEIGCLYQAEPLTEMPNEGYVIININKQHKRGNDSNAIYEATKGIWVIDKKKRDSLKYVLSSYRGLIVEVFEVESWYDLERKNNKSSKNPDSFKIGSAFKGRVAPEEIRKLYKNKHTNHIRNYGNPVRYKL